MATFTLQFSAYPFLDDCMGKSSPTKDGENMFLFGLVYVWVKIYIMRTHFSTNFKSLLACLKITQNNVKLSGCPICMWAGYCRISQNWEPLYY